MKFEEFIQQVKDWGQENSNVTSLLLVGSRARGQARADSDIDLVVICRDPRTQLHDLGWINEFGMVERKTLEDWGRVQSVRVFYKQGYEVEFGITSSKCAEIPIDPGTRSVLRGGADILLDKNGSLKTLLNHFNQKKV